MPRLFDEGYETQASSQTPSRTTRSQRTQATQSGGRLFGGAPQRTQQTSGRLGGDRTRDIPSGGGRLFGSTQETTTRPQTTNIDFDSSDLTDIEGLQKVATGTGLSGRAQRILDKKGESPTEIFSGGFISDVFDALNALQYGTAGVIKGDGFMEGVRTRSSFADKDALGGTILGTVAGIGLDIATDPLTYLGGAGILSKASKAVKTSKQFKGASKFLRNTKIGQEIGKRFVYGFGQDPVYKKMFERFFIGKNQKISQVAKLARPIVDLDKSAQKAIAEARKAGTLNDLPSELVEKAKPAYDELDRLGKEAVDLGLLDKDVYDENVGKYLPRLYRTKEGEKAATKAIWESTPERINLDRFKKRKDIPEEVREAMGEYLEAGYPTAKGLLQLTRSVENAKFFKEVSKKWGLDEAADGLKQLPDSRGLGDLRNKYVPEPIFDSLTEIANPKKWGPKSLQTATKVFKFGKVVANPATHARNIMSNFMLNDFNGLSPARIDIYAKAAKEMANKGDMYKEAQKAGLGFDTFQASEIEGLLETASKQSKLGKGFRKSMQKIADVYQKEEEFAKMAQYIYQRGKGLTPDQAMQEAWKSTFNYAQVTPFIRKLRESLFGLPFVTFTAKATPFVGKTILQNPQRISKYGKIKEGIEAQGDQEKLAAEREAEPNWFRDGYYMRLPIEDEDGRSAYIDLTYIIPFGSLISGEYFSRQVDQDTGIEESLPEAIAKMSPAGQALTQLVQNQDFYGNKIYKSSDGIDNQMVDVFRHLGDTLAPALATNLIPGGYKDDGERRPSRFGRILRQAMEDGEELDINRGGFQERQIQQELLRQIGIKIAPVDLETQQYFSEREKRRAIQTLLREEGITREFLRQYIPTEED